MRYPLHYAITHLHLSLFMSAGHTFVFVGIFAMYHKSQNNRGYASAATEHAYALDSTPFPVLKILVKVVKFNSIYIIFHTDKLTFIIY